MKKRVFALGFFDGVHLGHQQILKTAGQLAEKLGAESAVLTFRSHPKAYVLGISPDMITTFDQRCTLIRQQGIEKIIALPFNAQIANTSPEDFAALLMDKYKCVAVVCGQNFRFGKNAAGTPELLAKKGLNVSICPPVRCGDGSTISSTAIRRLVKEGDVQKAAIYLGRPFFIDGKIVSGNQIGRKFGFPTINTRAEPGMLLPKNGVYVTKAEFDGKSLRAVTNVGTRPTFSDADMISIESHLLDFSENIYGSHSKVSFLSYIRPERAFASGDELKAQIENDKKRAAEYKEEEL